jgi:LuxR family maltose regulon positive regulatory protein
VLEAEILQTLLLHAKGETEASLISLNRALERGRHSGVMRPFLTQGETLIQLLKQGKKTWESPELLEFVNDLLRKSDPHFATGDRGLETLSPRELEVLQYLPRDMTIDVLADELYISANTLRSHIKNIYAKLDVHSRHQAVDKARNLNLL